VAVVTWLVAAGRVDRWLPDQLLSRAGGAPISLSMDMPRWLCLVGGLLVVAPTLVWLWQQYTISIWRNGHGLFLPLIVFWLARSELRRSRPPLGSDPVLAWPFLVVGLALSWLGTNTGLGQVGTIGLVLLAPGLSLLLIGREATRRIAFPLSLLVFLMPVPEGLIDPLHLASSSMALAEEILHMAGLAGQRIQTVFFVPGLILGVSANCSGMSTFYAGLLAAIVLSRDMHPVMRIAVPLGVWPVTVCFNATRIFLMAAIANRWGSGFLHTAFHGLLGIATFWAVIGSVGLLVLILRGSLARRLT
jgi:exosortase